VESNAIWFGNEVACGVGMQKIDILTLNQNAGRREYGIIELKDEPIQPDVVDHIEYYVNWASQNSGRHLEGRLAGIYNLFIIVGPPHDSRSRRETIEAFKNYNQKKLSPPIRYFEFEIYCGRSIVFNEVNYD